MDQIRTAKAGGERLRHSIELKPKPSNYEKPISMAFKIWMGVYALLILLGFSFASNWKAPASPEMRRDTGQIEQSVFPGPATPQPPLAEEASRSDPFLDSMG